jgi:transposase
LIAAFLQPNLNILAFGAKWAHNVCMRDLESLSREELIDVIVDQHRLIERLQADVEQLKKRGSAAPFSKGASGPNPKPPGRKPGQGYFRFREVPEQARKEEATTVPVAAGDCPCCGSTLGEVRQEVVSITDIPVELVPEVRLYAVEVRRCPGCGKSVRGRHPGIASGQQGATAHRVGPRVKALAHILHYAHGVPVRKTAEIVEQLTGVRRTQSAITQDAAKQTEGPVGERYGELRESVKQQAVIHTDDTGWRVGGAPAYLMAFVNQSLSVYQVRRRHRNEEVRALIPGDFQGVMICDRGPSYDARQLEEVAQQKCLSHLIRNAKAVEESKTGRARQFSRRLKELLQQALALSARKNDPDVADYARQVEELGDELTIHLRDRTLRDEDNQRLLDGVGVQHDNARVLTFLTREGVEPTNNRAERDLRPAVIARKVSHCSRNETGARAFEAFTSVLQTFRKTNPAGMVAALIELISPPAPA